MAPGQPDLLAQARQEIVKGGVRLGRPGGLLDLQGASPLHPVPSQDDQAGEATHERGGALTCQIGSLPLGLDAQMRPTLFNSGLQRPAMREGEDDRVGRAS